MANQKGINSTAKTIENLENKFDTVFIGVFVVVLITALAPIIDAWRFKAASYEALVQKINDQNTEIKGLQDEVSDLNTALGVKKTIEINLPSEINIKKELKIGE